MRIDWSSRAAAALENQSPKVTDKTDESRPPLSSHGVSSVSSVLSDDALLKPGGVSSVLSVLPEGASGEALDLGGANHWHVFYKSGAIREITFSPARSAAEVAAHCPGAIAMIEMSSTLPACAVCQHATRYGNCGAPIAAGLADRFVLIDHPEGGRGCAHFEPEAIR